MKRLGQHFLNTSAGGKKIIADIIEAAELKKTDIVLEVGPGKGVLTEALLEKAKKVIAIEKDEKLVEFLKEKFFGRKNLQLTCGDILKIENLKIKNFKIVANIPYYITSRFLRKFLTARDQPETMVLMIQKEVAERICAKNKKESLLSISVKAYGNPKIARGVSAGNFSPPPKVDSAVIKIENISRNFFHQNGIGEEKFFETVKKGFSQKRKMLKNNLKISSEALARCGLSEKARAEDLNLKDWACLISVRKTAGSLFFEK
ncbi:MAG: 16S rRNA (adenine(1518)-N(6)/adenine(1519)-N(6))-dimethyltransferase RsmA [Candidatus Pacebacteria bacterium]|nr:16S rRNA (adenine(1518)-N(6)/adenine(1519)-N(6))-dimethyltransferase RsmA [Candidatus Paceibacterota bacterium]